MKMDANYFEKHMIKEKDLVCRIGDHLRVITNFESTHCEIDKPEGPTTTTKAAGQIYRVDDR